MSKLKSNDELDKEIPKSSNIFMNKKDKIPLSPISRIGHLDLSVVNNRRELSKPVLQSKELYHTLIDSPCTKLGKVQFTNALSSATKYLLNRHLESVNQNTDIFKESTPGEDVYSTNKSCFNEFKTPQLIDLSFTPEKKTHEIDCQTQISNTLIEEIEQQKKNEIEDIRQTKLLCSHSIKIQLKEIELEIEKTFSILENKVTENYDKLLKKVYDEKTDSIVSQNNTVIAVKKEKIVNEEKTEKGKNYTRMTGAYGVLNNFNKECSFLKTPKGKGSQTREEMMYKGSLTPSTMAFVVHEQLMHLNSSS